MAVHYWKLIGLLSVAFFSAAALPSWAQTPAQPAAGETLSPEQAVEEAINKIDMGDFVEARRLLQYAASLKPTMNSLKLGMGLFNVASNQGAEAISVLGTYNATDEGKRDYRGFAAIGKVYLDARMLRQAVSPLRQARSLADAEKDGKPLRAGITIELASVYAKLRDSKKAIELIKEVRAAARDDAEIQLRISEIATTANDTGLAKQAANRAIELFKGRIVDDAFNAEAYTAMKRAFEVLGNLVAFNISNDPENGENYHQSAGVLRETAELDRRIGFLSAREMVLRAIEQDPKNSQWQLSAVRLEMELGGLAEAGARLATVLEYEPSNAEALRLKQLVENPSPRAAQP